MSDLFADFKPIENKPIHTYKRITDKNPKRYLSGRHKVYKKLQKLENIEEELGIDLITLFKALKSDKAYMKDYGKIFDCIVYSVLMKSNEIYVELRIGNVWNWNRHLPTREYGVTWALTKKELEDANS